MEATRDQIRHALGVRPTIDPATEIARRVEFLADYILTTGVRGLTLGISGGQDSTLAGRLCQLAVEELRRRGAAAEFWAIRLPHHVQADESDAQDALEFIRADHELVINIGSATDAAAAEYNTATGEAITDFGKGNVKARMRMIAQFELAGEKRLLVAGTDHAAEAVTGFFTKFGDGAADVVPLAGLNKRQGRALLDHLGAPEHLVRKVPTADLLDDAPGQTDESSLGLSYDQIDDFLEGRDIEKAAASLLIEKYRATEHKRRTPVAPTDSWWIRH
ncbi:MAG: ammonia-dependent NAD(+) synthetase [Brevibacterium aurantiacum]|nr:MULTISPECIES: ammonia-dependent NAD(+) synthetase [Brevibacterium]AZL06068.1 ammonia-dependent NAD(+) synthetase [Brevibacterium aurantiacum]AZL09626.1 ammonia-dependent NAD(+) synthetase [Brevibacterium aurantiacum]AZL13261.1 ammonia-dependent NAD(+) synthetase [Brevibacterium aurantiacum]AZT93757.1 ammonia-dependent NAD(+) synthetase [Brevibacterium aurantiacum]AZT97547.1 ammonia-dependent NAD(+) synthetase [Brevibacterium aurantiacum]